MCLLVYNFRFFAVFGFQHIAFMYLSHKVLLHMHAYVQCEPRPVVTCCYLSIIPRLHNYGKHGCCVKVQCKEVTQLLSSVHDSLCEPNSRLTYADCAVWILQHQPT